MSNSTAPNGRRSGRNGAGEARAAISSRRRALTCLRVDSSLSMKAVTAEVDALLEGIDEGLRHRSTVLARELIAQVVRRSPERNQQEIGLSIELRAESIRLEASGPVLPGTMAGAHNGVARDALADWGTFAITRLADRWGTGRGSHRYVWADIAFRHKRASGTSLAGTPAH